MKHNFFNTRRASTVCGRPLVLLIVAASLVACGSQNPPSSQSGLNNWNPSMSSGATGSGNNSAQDVLPLQAYIVLGRDRETIEKAIVILEQKCMDKQGFSIRIPDPVPESGPGVDLAARRYGLDSLQAAKSVGFHSEFDTPEILAARDRNSNFDASLSKEQETAMAGDGPVARTARFRHGCVGEADKKLMQGTSSTSFSGLATSPIVTAVNLDPRAVDSPETSAALQKFGQCMADAGYPTVKDPRSVANNFLNQKTPSPDEIKAATVQFNCQQSSGTTAAMRAAETKFQLAAIEANPEGFATVKSENETLVRRATEVVGNA